MKILALEFSSPLRSVAVAADGTIRGTVTDSGGRPARPFALIDSALSEAGLKGGEIDCVVVGLGPGSHAGIRIAIAIAQGWQMARGTRLLGISSAEAVAAQAGRSGRREVWLGLDAQRNELFVARYNSAANPPQLLEPFRLWSPAHEAGPEDILRMDLASSPDGIPSAASLALLAGTREHFVAGASLEPVYLRMAEFVKQPPTFKALKP